MSKSELHHYAWIDVETTGLDISRDPVIEIACVITDLDLNRIAQFDTPVDPGRGLLDARLEMNDYVRDMHTRNGLIFDVLNNSVKTHLAEHGVRSVLEENCYQNMVAIAGSGVAQFDQPLLRLQMPSITDYMTYYPMDIGVIRRFIKYTLKRPDLLLPESESSHRAAEDVDHALREAIYYRDCLGELPVKALDEEG